MSFLVLAPRRDFTGDVQVGGVRLVFADGVAVLDEEPPESIRLLLVRRGYTFRRRPVAVPVVDQHELDEPEVPDAIEEPDPEE